MDQIIEFTQSDFTELVEGVTMLASDDENTLMTVKINSGFYTLRICLILW